MSSEAEVLEQVEQRLTAVLRLLDFDLTSEHFKGTPNRVARWLNAIKPVPSSVLEQHVRDLMVLFPSVADEMVVVRDIRFNSLCPHHLLPVVGTAHVGYVPNGSIVGLSKIPRLVHLLARQPIAQEDLTTRIANTFEHHLQPRGVIVVINAEHMCMRARGVEEPEASMTTSALRGVFLDNKLQSKQEFFELLKL